MILGLTNDTKNDIEDYSQQRSPWRDAEYDVNRGHDKLKGSKLKGFDLDKQKPRFENEIDDGNDLNNDFFDDEGKYSKRRRAVHRVYGKHCSLTFLFLLPLSKPVSLSFPRISSILKHPKQVFF